MPKLTWPNSTQRLWLYGIAVATLGVLVVYHLVDPSAVPAWLALAAAVLGAAGHATAIATVVAQRSAGTAEVPAKVSGAS
jgi:uncharacterized membrane protein YjjB (DUF3815 family)